MPQERKKPGPKPKVTDEAKTKVLGVVGAGGSIPDAAGIIEVGVRTLQRALREDRHFGTGVKKARKSAKMRLIQKVTSAKAWQAAAWMLERMYGAEFGRKDTLNVKAKHDHIHQVRKDVAALSQDPEAVKAVDAYARRLDAIELKNGNGHPQHEKAEGSGDLN